MHRNVFMDECYQYQYDSLFVDIDGTNDQITLE